MHHVKLMTRKGSTPDLPPMFAWVPAMKNAQTRLANIFAHHRYPTLGKGTYGVGGAASRSSTLIDWCIVSSCPTE